MANVTPKEEKQLRQGFDELIRDVEGLFKEAPIQKERQKPETTALGNLTAVAQTASCLKEIELFLQYQAARDFKKWEGDHRFASNLVKRLVPGGIVETSARRAADACETEDDRVEDLKVWQATQYLGFVRRKFQYLEEFMGGSK